VAVDEAHKRNRQVAAHVRGNDGVKLCVAAGVDVLEHATYADDQAIAMIAERKDDIFVVPGLGYHWGILVNGPACGITPEHLATTEYQEEWDLGCVAMDKLRRAGVRVVPGGDLRLCPVPPRPVREGHRVVRHRHGLLADGGIVASTKHRRRAAPAGARVRHGRGSKAPTSSSSTATRSATSRSCRISARLAMVMANGKVMVNTLGCSELTNIPGYLMDIEHIQNANAAVPTMPTAAEVQHGTSS
jgi:hypothetical protein